MIAWGFVMVLHWVRMVNILGIALAQKISNSPIRIIWLIFVWVFYTHDLPLAA